MSTPHYTLTDRDGDKLEIRNINDGAFLCNRGAEKGEYVTVVVRSDERRETAQAVAGDRYRVVPVEQTTWACEPQPDASAPNTAAMHEDLHSILHALGLSTAARASSPHEVVEREIVPAIWRLRAQAVQAGRPAYPYPEGDALVLGPETLIDRDRATICHKGVNYIRQPDRPEPVDPASVRVGDQVEIEADDGSWMVRGPVKYSDTNAPRGEAYRLIVGGPQFEEEGFCPDLAEATVRILHAAEPEPDEAAVEALAPIVQKVCAVEPHHAVQFARDLARHGVQVEVHDA